MPSSFVRAERPARTSPAVSQMSPPSSVPGAAIRSTRASSRASSGAMASTSPARLGAPGRVSSARSADDDRGVLDEGRIREAGVGRQPGEREPAALEHPAVLGVLVECARHIGRAEPGGGQAVGEVGRGRAHQRAVEAEAHRAAPAGRSSGRESAPQLRPSAATMPSSSAATSSGSGSAARRGEPARDLGGGALVGPERRPPSPSRRRSRGRSAARGWSAPRASGRGCADGRAANRADQLAEQRRPTSAVGARCRARGGAPGRRPRGRAAASRATG